MAQLSFENNGERFLPVLDPRFQVGFGATDNQRIDRRRFGVQIEEEDVIELDRRFDDADGSVRFEPRQSQRAFDFSLPPRGFTSGNDGGFQFDRDVVANIYASNENLGNGQVSGGNLNLVA